MNAVFKAISTWKFIRKNKICIKTLNIILLLMMCYSFFMVLQIVSGYLMAHKEYNKVQNLYKASRTTSSGITATDVSSKGPKLNQVNIEKRMVSAADDQKGTKDNIKILDKFIPLLEKNKDIIGWVDIPDTNISYPVVQTKDNSYYLHKDFNGKESRNGSIFMDFRNNLKKRNPNTVIYGHNMKDGSMFCNLTQYTKKDFYEKHMIINFDTLYKENRWEIFSAYVTDVNFDYIKTDFDATNEFAIFLDTIKKKSLINSDINLTTGDDILTLSTCSYQFKNARMVVHARLLNK